VVGWQRAEYCLIVEGAYLSESEAEHALRDPFIEDWVEQTGHFKIHNMNEIQVTAGVTLGSLGVSCLTSACLKSPAPMQTAVD